MIPYNTITAWSVNHPWTTREQVEQDLLLSKAICDIFNHESLSKELVFRGGTALHKLILEEPYRYSEDLDFVRVNPGGIGGLMKELTELGNKTGYLVKTRIGKFPKLYWQTKAQTGLNLRIKIEINTYERFSALPLKIIKHDIQTEWFTGTSDVVTFQFEEIAATKLRALFQRTKGRDLFDLWLLTTEVGVDTSIVNEAFSVYRPEGYTGKKAIINLREKLNNPTFNSDIKNLISANVKNYYPNEAAEIIINEYLSKL